MSNNTNNKKICVGMSGGVDSSVTAYLLKKQGYDVIGVTLELHDKNSSEDSDSEIAQAKKIASKLGIEYEIIDYRDSFQNIVMKNFIDEYSVGHTPNPCIMCNPNIKWKAMLEFADKIGAEYVATGHYANILQLENGRYTIKMADSKAKDQTYALNRLTQEQLKRTIMPLGAYSKDEIRNIAREIDLEIANKPDSQDICFIPDGDYVNFILNSTDKTFPEGDFVDTKGNILGKHKGILNYTYGQRKGLGIALGKPAFVTNIDIDANQVVIGDNEDCFKSTLIAKDINYMGIEKLDTAYKCMGKIRYAHKAAPCTISLTEDKKILCEFDSPQRAITPGQSVVFYENEYILASGIIE